MERISYNIWVKSHTGSWNAEECVNGEESENTCGVGGGGAAPPTQPVSASNMVVLEPLLTPPTSLFFFSLEKQGR